MEFDLEKPLLFGFDQLHEDTIAYLFDIESDHMPSKTNYHQSVNKTNIRQETISLILQISHPFDPFLTYLAINYLDRFLSFRSLSEGKPWILKLIAVSCASLALKMRTAEFSATDIQQDGAIVFDSKTIKRMEFLILGCLKWRMRSITAFSFINFFISLFKLNDSALSQSLKARATEIIFRAQREINLLRFKPSIISASALLHACHEQFPLQFACSEAAILNCSYVNKNDLLSCYKAMQEVAKEGYESVLDMVSSSSSPVNVLELQCSSSSSSDTEPITILEESSRYSNAIATSRQENELKRRKISKSSAFFMHKYRSDI